MTIESNISKNTHIGNGVTIHFPFTYKIWKKEEMLVTIEDENGITSNITPYDVILGDNGGEVVLYIDNENKTPIPKGYTIALTRNMDFLQEQDYINGGRFNADVVEENFDMITAELQQLLESSERTIKVPVTSSTEPEELLNELYNARNIAVEQAGVATQQAQISTEQATLSGSYAQTANEQAVLSQQYADISRRWAESDTPPDPNDPNSKSAKSWAEIASDTVPLATDVLPGKVAPQYPLVTDDTGNMTYDGYNRGWGAKDSFLSGAVIQGDVDLNTITDNGFYNVLDGTTGNHRPSSSYLILFVCGGLEPGPNSTTVARKLQIAYDLNSAKIYVRISNNVGAQDWGAWRDVSWSNAQRQQFDKLVNSYNDNIMFASSDYIDLSPTWTTQNTQTSCEYTAPANGFIQFSFSIWSVSNNQTSGGSNCIIGIRNPDTPEINTYSHNTSGWAGQYAIRTVPIKAGQLFKVHIDGFLKNIYIFRFVYAEGALL